MKRETYRRIIVTPELAQKWLTEKNSGNRNLNMARVNFYAEQMKNGEWGHTSTPITFWKDDTLGDGQHRLAAIVKSGVSISMTIAYGFEKNGNYDNGLTRSCVDSLKMEGAGSYTSTEVAVAKLALLAEDISLINTKISHTDVARWFEKNDVEDIRKVINALSKYGRSEIGSVNTKNACIILAAYGYYLAHGEGTLEKLSNITRIIKKGYPINTNGEETIGKLRNAMLAGFYKYAEKGHLLTRSHVKSRTEKLRLFQNAFELYHQNKKVRGSLINIPDDYVFPVSKAQ